MVVAVNTLTPIVIYIHVHIPDVAQCPYTVWLGGDVGIIDDFSRPSGKPTNDDDDQPDHKHKWFMVQSKSEFQLINPGNDRLFEKQEFAILICSISPCTAVIRKRIEDA